MKKLFYIDPQSYNNLSIYDYSLLGGIDDCNITYYHNRQYQCKKIPNATHKSIFSYSQKKSNVTKSLSYICSISSIVRDITREKPDIVHIQWLRLWIIDILFAIFIRMIGCKLIFTAHNTLPHNPHKGDKTKYKLYYKIASAIIVHTQRTKRELTQDFGVKADKINVIPHGILDNNITNERVGARCDELRRKLSIHPGDVVFSCLGYQYKYKGISLVVDAWEKSLRLNGDSQCHLLIVGKNRDVEEDVLNKARTFRNAFVLDEQLDDLDFDAYLKLTSVVLLPYISISQSGLMFSAMCSNTPILVSDIGGLTDPLHYAKVGWCFGEPTMENLREKMEWLADNPHEIEDIRNDHKAFDQIRDVYSWSRISAMTSQLYILLSGKN